MNPSRVIALGFFDGVHLGHGQLLARCRLEANRLGLKAAALTFDRHPDTLVSGENVMLLTAPRERARLMQELYGIEELLTLHFDRATMNMPWEVFLRDVLAEQYGAGFLVCGHDFRFGRRGLGTARGLREAAPRLGMGCAVIAPYEIEGITVSSTYIRSLVEAGDLDRARRYLGHPFTLSGTVVGGRGLGHTWGIPTANLSCAPEQLLPPKGVYACRAVTDSGTYLAVANIGTRPTVGGHHLTVEPWLLDFEGDLYGKAVTLELWHYLRGEKTFPDTDALQQEIRRNAEQTRAYFR
ncbi:MAG: riboflavin biosynthesis protein RibF [Faecousia sp.]